MLIDDAILNARSAYERQFAGQIGAEHAVAFGYARTGLRAILSGIGVRPGDEVVLSPLTCKVVPLTLLSLEVKPVYADVSLETLNLDPEAVRRAMALRTRAILFQHTYGNGAGLHEVARIASDRGVPLIEDRAQCLPIPDPITGTAAVYSNNLLKPLPAASGGVAVTEDPALAEKLAQIAGRLPEPGFSARMRLHVEAWLQRRVLRPELYWLALRWSGRFHLSEILVENEIAAEISGAMHRPSAAQMRAGARWLAHVDYWAKRRLECCLDYRALLASSMELPPIDFRRPLYYFPVRTRRKRAVLREAERRRMELIAWPKSMPIYPIESEPALRAYGFEPDSCPSAMKLAGELIGLPTHDKITPRHRRRIADLLRSFHA